MKTLLSSLIGLFLATVTLAAPSARLTVDLNQPGVPVSPLLYGIFFEDINCSADGGLYAELVRNRNFEEADKPDYWIPVSSGDAIVEMTIDTTQPASAKNPRSLKVTIQKTGPARVGVANNGFWGMSVLKGELYEFSMLGRAAQGFSGPLTVSLESADGVRYAERRISRLSSDWKEYRVALKAKATDPRARLVISAARPGTFWLDMVSLFPRNTWQNRPQGLRPDLATMLAELQPGFVRFPGGCWVEGETMKQAYRWKETIGPLSERRTQYNIWQYHATHGLGYHEYLQLCEDLKAEPLFVINCGMSHRENVPMDRMQEFVQDALDAIEYANGPVTSTWGALRARHGHPAPFKLKFLQIGNENGGPAYNERYALFHDAIKSKYPQIALIANEWNGRPGNRPLEIVDEHYYSTPEFFINNAGKYDSYSRSGPRIYVGEYAVTRNGGQGNLRAALGEAAFMTGMERNSDVVVMSSYAPLFANVHHKKWNPDLINFDSSRAYGLPGYYVQQLFSRHRADTVVPLSIEAQEIAATPKSGAIGLGTWLTQAEYKDVKVERDGQVLFAADFTGGTGGWRLHGGEWSAQDGVMRQQGSEENIRAFAGDKSWSNYTYSLKARKTGGREGFLIPFLVQDENAKCWWNIGGWGNARHAIEMDGIIANEVNGSIETGRWYDIRIELAGSKIKCFLDGKLIHDVGFPALKPLHGVAGIAGKEVVLKVVNVASVPATGEVNFNGSCTVGSGQVIVLTSENPEDENSLDQPNKVVPITREFRVNGRGFQHAFPPHSLTVFRLKLNTP